MLLSGVYFRGGIRLTLLSSASNSLMPSSQQSHMARSFSDRLAVVIASSFGVGFSPIAPGTAGSVVSVLAWLALHHWCPSALRISIHLIWLGALCLVGIWACTRCESWFGKVDPQQAVVDEVVGQQIAYVGLVALDWRALLLGFALFRLFDVWKPYPIRKLQHLKGGVGVMLDDVLAGFYAFVILFLIRRWLNWM